MAVACARCGTSNPDGNAFCQACGAPLAVVAAAPAVPAAATAASPFTVPPPVAGTYPGQAPAGPPPMAAPPPFQSPYYAPGSGLAQPAVHRTPWMLIIAAVVALVLVMAGVGTVMALALGNHKSQTGGFQALASPSPAGSPSPVPSSNPTGGGATASNDGLAVVVPAGWTVLNKDAETITLESPNGDGSITLGAGASSPPQSAQQNKAQLDQLFTQKYPDTKECPGTKTSNGTLGGASGIYWQLCFTLTSGQQSIQVGAPIFAGANASGSVYYASLLETQVANMDNFISECKPILNGITWKVK